MTYTLTVNGQRRTVDVPERMPLLWVLRDTLGLKGTKFGCGMAQCGACTVLVDGQPTRACITPVSAVGTRTVSTIEGLLMSASALLRTTPNPTDDQIDAAMSGNVCRCGTYLRIKQAIKVAANGGRRA
jgi:isoquinoline 1-oxidoreductase alpha subunit